MAVLTESVSVHEVKLIEPPVKRVRIPKRGRGRPNTKLKRLIYDKAAAFRGALKLHPDYAEVRLHLGMLLKRQGRLEDAEEQFQLFKELMPECKEMDIFAEELEM
jgi:tetratricopeptide (TPR) repeat protein